MTCNWNFFILKVFRTVRRHALIRLQEKRNRWLHAVRRRALRLYKRARVRIAGVPLCTLWPLEVRESRRRVIYHISTPGPICSAAILSQTYRPIECRIAQSSHHRSRRFDRRQGSASARSPHESGWWRRAAARRRRAGLCILSEINFHQQSVRMDGEQVGVRLTRDKSIARQIQAKLEV